MKKLIPLISLLPACLLAACSPRNISPYFEMDREALQELITNLPAAGDEEKILASPEAFLELVHASLTQPRELLWLVDKTHKLAQDYEPEDLVDLKDYPVPITKPSLLVRALIIHDLQAMVKAAAGEGLTLNSSSTYRSYARQEWLFDYWVRQLGQAEAEVVSARPGTSQHQLGTTIDFHPIDDSFAAIPESPWLQKNGWRFGFSLSYPEGYLERTGYTYEPWHWRYLGRAGAELCETYFRGKQQDFLEFWAERHKQFAARHKAPA